MHDAAVSHSIHIVLASRNPVKRRAAENGFQRVFPDYRVHVSRTSVPSGVPDQPGSDDETLAGAENRAAGAQQADPEADYWVGIEGGIADHGEEMVAFAWVVVRSRTLQGRSRASSFVLPPEVAALVRQGHELGEANDIAFSHTNSKQKEGAVGILTGGVVDRTKLYEQSVILALIPFRNPAMYEA